jgi:hypothetical protein
MEILSAVPAAQKTQRPEMLQAVAKLSFGSLAIIAAGWQL